MSYILDALKKSESERQRQDAPGFAHVPLQAARRGTPTWIWLIGGLLLVNAVVLGGFLLRGSAAGPGAVQTVAIPQPQQAPARLAPRANNPAPLIDTPATAGMATVEEATQRLPPPVRAPVRTTTAPPAATQRTVEAAPSTSGIALPSLLELSANGTVQLPELHLDVHVFSAVPADRFVFINMSKYREAARLADGPLVKEIVPEGVILEYEGNTFLLPRD
ncbi:MAG: general secretion pathway protein GspB [Woeseia sp.]